ncbi:DUF819 domain-containing protein [Chloropicon primus]|uniref:DUF819 domain-containing protein n=1 Tax=Chloropicon primus TaxID=1764295 RepID=A0A5B8MMA7_9CHLO|nr:DUF819 domain-containing protein [Chloropicon primus]|eukprot:QDZ21164.1 DUF819 domain-containing protein [Chloropicon primus]
MATKLGAETQSRCRGLIASGLRRRGSRRFLPALERGLKSKVRPSVTARGVAPGIAEVSGIQLHAVLLGCSLAGETLEERTPLGRALSGPVTTMLLGAVLVNLAATIGIGFDLAELRSTQSLLVGVATPLLLYGANIRALVSGAKRLLPGFALASVGTLLGAVLGALVLGGTMKETMGSLSGSSDIAGMIAALAAKNVGGGFNFVAVVESASVSSALVALALAADNVAALIYFPLNSFLAGPPVAKKKDEVSDASVMPKTSFGAGEITLCLFVSLVILAVASALAGGGGNTIAISSALAVSLATLMPRTFEALKSPGYSLAQVFLGLFFASAGLVGGKVVEMENLGAFLPICLLLAIIYACHLAFVFLAALLFKMRKLDCGIVSNAAIGGPATAAALAKSKGVDPTSAVLVGNLGNALATFLALALVPLLHEIL